MNKIKKRKKKIKVYLQTSIFFLRFPFFPTFVDDPIKYIPYLLNLIEKESHLLLPF